MIRLSIIIPFYNVEPFITQCLDSVYQQDIPESEYEVICVNDASPDNSSEIVKEFQKKHGNLILVEHEVNKKLGAARNTGRAIARGNYIWNVDSDDMVVPNCLKEMLDICEENNLDVFVFSHKLVVNNEIKNIDARDVFTATQCISGIEFMRQYAMKQMHIISPVWKQLFRREFLDENAIYSPEINMSEDVPYTYKSIALAQRLQVKSESYYIYRINPQSIGGVMAKAPSAIAAYESCFVVSRELFHLSDKVRQEAKDVGEAILKVGRWCMMLYGYYMGRMEIDQRKEFLSLCRNNFWKNRDVLRYLNWRVGVRYLRYLLSGYAIREV